MPPAASPTPATSVSTTMTDRRSTTSGVGALLFALGTLGTLAGWAALALPAPREPESPNAPTRGLSATDLADIPEVAPIDTTLPRPDVVTVASRR